MRRLLRNTLLGVTLGLLAACSLGHVKAQEVRPSHGHAHSEMALHDQFYSKWNRPNGGAPRSSSCCNKQDCFPTEIKVEGGVCKALKPASYLQECDDYGGCKDTATPIPAHWVVFDCMKLEELQKDPEESPDGMSHACIARYSDQVFCAVRGSLQ